MIGFKGAVQSLTIIGLGILPFYYFRLEFISMIGLILSFFPILNSFGKVTSLIHNGEINVNDGKRVVSAGVNFIIISVLAILLTQIFISLSFIPRFRISYTRDFNQHQRNFIIYYSGIIIYLMFCRIYFPQLLTK